MVNYAVARAVIANAASLSRVIDLGGKRLAGIVMPSGWTAAALTFQVSPDGQNFFNLYDAFGTEVTVQAALSRAISLSAVDWLAFRFIKIRSGTSAVPVAQGAERILTLPVLVL
jgi:hypothetical protein